MDLHEEDDDVGGRDLVVVHRDVRLVELGARPDSRVRVPIPSRFAVRGHAQVDEGRGGPLDRGRGKRSRIRVVELLRGRGRVTRLLERGRELDMQVVWRAAILGAEEAAVAAVLRDEQLSRAARVVHDVPVGAGKYERAAKGADD